MIAKLGRVYLDLSKVFMVGPLDMDGTPEDRSYEIFLLTIEDSITVYEKEQEDSNDPVMEYEVFIDLWKGSIET